MGFEKVTRAPSVEMSKEILSAFLERIEKMEEEKKAVIDDIKDIYAEIKGTGYDAKIVKQIVKLRSMDRDQRLEMEALLDIYKTTLGMD